MQLSLGAGRSGAPAAIKPLSGTAGAATSESTLHTSGPASTLGPISGSGSGGGTSAARGPVRRAGSDGVAAPKFSGLSLQVPRDPLGGDDPLEGPGAESPGLGALAGGIGGKQITGLMYIPKEDPLGLWTGKRMNKTEVRCVHVYVHLCARVRL
jgi:hypothetical protein